MKISFNKEVQSIIDVGGYEKGYEYCKCKYNHYIWKNNITKAKTYANQIEMFKRIGMKEYKVHWKLDGAEWESNYYSLVSYKKGCLISVLNVDGYGEVVSIISE